MANNFANALLAILVIAVLGIGAFMIFGPDDAVDTGTGAPVTKTGDQGTLKLSAETVSQDNRAQIATTGYCWDQSTPSKLIESRNGKTLSTSAGTTFSPAFRGKTYECTAFSSSHWCDHESELMADEGLELRAKCYNISGASEVKVTYFEDDAADTTPILQLGAGQTNNFNKFMLEVNVTDKAYKVKGICFGSNVSNSHIKDIEVKNWNKDVTPDSLGSTADDFCYQLSNAVKLEEWESKVFNDGIIVAADSTGIASGADELITVTFADECEYVTDDGEVKTDWFKRDTDGEADCGATNPTANFKVTSTGS